MNHLDQTNLGKKGVFRKNKADYNSLLWTAVKTRSLILYRKIKLLSEKQGNVVLHNSFFLEKWSLRGFCKQNMLLSTRMTFASYGIGKKRCPRLDATCSQLEDVTHDKGVVQFR